MSHIVRIQTQIRDPVAVQAACARLGLAHAEQGTFHLYGGAATGLAVQLPGWRYPVVCRTDVGELQFDNYSGAWGAVAELHRFQQAYAVEKARLEARRQGHAVTEHALADGSVRLTVHVGDRA